MSSLSIELAVRVLVAGLLGGLVGINRELSDKDAGLRTHILVAIGAALFTAVGPFALEDNLLVDPTRVAAQVVVGIGFLGAGAIIRLGTSVRGLTTAAGLWVTAAIGSAAGAGFWAGAAAATAGALLALFAFKPLEDRLLHKLRPGRTEITVIAEKDLSLHDVTDVIDRHSCRLEGGSISTVEDSLRFVMVLLAPKEQVASVAQDLRGVRGVQSVDF